MPKIVDREMQRTSIREAARRVFARRGVAGTGLVHVAEAAGMGRSSLYHYYPDKASLVRDVARELLEDEAQLFAAVASASGSPQARLERLVATVADLFSELRGLGRMILQLWASDVRRFRPYFRRIREQLAELIEQGQREGEMDPELNPELTAAAVIALLDGMLLQCFVDPVSFSDKDAVREMMVGAVNKVVKP